MAYTENLTDRNMDINIVKEIGIILMVWGYFVITVHLVLNVIFSKCKNMILKITIYRWKGRLYKYETHK